MGCHAVLFVAVVLGTAAVICKVCAQTNKEEAAALALGHRNPFTTDQQGCWESAPHQSNIDDLSLG